MRSSVLCLAAVLMSWPVASRAHLPETAPAPTEEEIQSNLRAARMGLGSRVTANVLLIGPPRATWVEAAGGAEGPGDLGWPLDGGRLLRGYGSGRRGRHRALDIGAAAGTEIRAAERGIVAYADREVRGYGNLAMVVHPGGWVTYYAHASELLVRPGQIVARGEAIARVGHTGSARGDHLHFELRRDGARIDPAPFLVGLPAGLRLAEHQPLVHAARTHRVRRGDNLLRISRRTGVPVRRLIALNGLRRTSRLRIGQTLLLPPSEAPAHRRLARRRRPR